MMNPYLLWASLANKRLTEQGCRLGLSERSRLVAKMWRAMNAVDKAKLTATAASMNAAAKQARVALPVNPAAVVVGAGTTTTPMRGGDHNNAAAPQRNVFKKETLLVLRATTGARNPRELARIRDAMTPAQRRKLAQQARLVRRAALHQAGVVRHNPHRAFVRAHLNPIRAELRCTTPQAMSVLAKRFRALSAAERAEYARVDLPAPAPRAAVPQALKLAVAERAAQLKLQQQQQRFATA
jgi:hypothetical protein